MSITMVIVMTFVCGCVAFYMTMNEDKVVDAIIGLVRKVRRL